MTPLTEPARAALERSRRHNAAIGEVWILPSPTDSSKPISRHLLRDWWRRGEEAAGLDHVHGLGWHGLRRKFATELKEVPLPDLCALGGWKTPRTILECYQQPDRATMRRALKARKPLTAVGGE